MPARVEVRIGPPVDLAEYQETESRPGDVPGALKKMLRAIARLAGQPDFVPQLAGRVWKPTADELEIAMAEAETRERDSR
jgi:1-acyl-sn-glycerol-3-phosphate acyltransferase